MEGGRIVQRGTHEELMRTPGPYLRVADLQLVDRSDFQEMAKAAGGTA
jgi:ATP-binding cassette subfamily B protein